MAFVTRKITRTSQPQELVGIDQDRPSDSLAVLWSATNPKLNLVDRKPFSVSGGSFKPNGGGVGIGFSGGQGAVRFTDSSDYIYPPVFSVVWVASTAPVAYRVIIGSRRPTTGELDFFLVADATGGLIVQGTNGNYTTFKATLSGTTDGKNHVFAFVKRSASDHQFYCDGVPIQTTTSTSGNPFNNEGTVFEIGGINTGIASYDHQEPINLVALFFSDLTGSPLILNPWALFEPIQETIWIPDGVSVTLPTLVQPVSTTSAGAWTPTGAATLHEAINELLPSAMEYISVNSASSCTMLLEESATPTANTTLAYRASSTFGSTLTVTLTQGATEIMTRTHALTGTDTLYIHMLTAPELALIGPGQISVTLTTS